MTINFKLIVKVRPTFRKYRTRAENLRPILGRIADLMRGSISSEFSVRSWFRPRGGRQAWRPVVKFGTRKLASPTLGRDLRSAWMGGPGGTTAFTNKTVIIGVTVPYAGVHRGFGQVSDSPKDSVWRAKVPANTKRDYSPDDPQYWKAFWYILAKYKIALSERKLRGGALIIPARPHATRNPALNDLISRRIAAYVTRGVIV